MAIALAVVITVLVVRPADGGGGSGDPTQQNGDSEFASADDTGPVNIITEDPTCAPWGRVSREYSASIESADWKNRAKDLPATAWTPEQRLVFDSASKSMEKAAGESLRFARDTPSRLMRQLYQQFNAYSSNYITKLSNYQPADEAVVAVANTLVSVLSSVCSAIQYEAASAIASLVEGISPTIDNTVPTDVPPVMSLKAGDGECSELGNIVDAYNQGTADWQRVDPSVPVREWSTENRLIYESAEPIMVEAATRFQAVGMQSDSAVVQDLAFMTAQYIRAYVASLPSYSSADNYLIRVGNFLGGTLEAACAVES
ncbi:hypothetical protein [Mycobacterium hippophais]|uniref:hypothetical protein n=1 Tax=Mycobacterium hippophais TaxID=3016340 RepID=UPI0022B85E5F|nr:hypothetical protein [Mycobacterium hippophais]